MSKPNPAPHFIPRSSDPAENLAIDVLNDGLQKQLDAGGTDTAFWFAKLKQVLSVIANSPATHIAEDLDPMVGASMAAISLIGPALEKSLSNRDLVPACTCGKCGKSDDIIDSIH